MAAVVRERRRSATWKSGNASSMDRKRPAALIACSSQPRRRTTAPDTSSWASLPEELVGLIGWRVLAGDLLDYVRFRAVCPHWRSSTACPRGRGVIDPRFHPRQWMMLPEGHGLYPGHGKLRGYVRFFNLSTGAFVSVRLPLFKDHCVLDSADGILLLQRDHDTTIRLLNPFTGDIAEFPRLDTLLVPGPMQQHQWYSLRSILTTAISVSADGVITVMISLQTVQGLFFAASGDQLWRISYFVIPCCSNPLSFQGKIYVLDERHSCKTLEILQIDPPQQEGTDPGSLYLPPPKLIAKCPAEVSAVYYMVECNSEVLVVARHTHYEEFGYFSVYRLADLILERTGPVIDIGGNSLFLGTINSRMLSVSSKAFPIIVGNSIVFLELDGQYLAQYSLSTRTLLPTSDGRVQIGENTLPCPRSIFHYIYTCCFREKWNKGRMFESGALNWRVKRKWRVGVCLCIRFYDSVLAYAFLACLAFIDYLSLRVH